MYLVRKTIANFIRWYSEYTLDRPYQPQFHTIEVDGKPIVMDCSNVRRTELFNIHINTLIKHCNSLLDAAKLLNQASSTVNYNYNETINYVAHEVGGVDLKIKHRIDRLVNRRYQNLMQGLLLHDFVCTSIPINVIHEMYHNVAKHSTWLYLIKTNDIDESEITPNIISAVYKVLLLPSIPTQRIWCILKNINQMRINAYNEGIKLFQFITKTVFIILASGFGSALLNGANFVISSVMGVVSLLCAIVMGECDNVYNEVSVTDDCIEFDREFSKYIYNHTYNMVIEQINQIGGMDNGIYNKR